MISRQFYIEVGKLLYAVSRSDGFVQEKEKGVVSKIIEKELNKINSHFRENIHEKESLLTKISFGTSERNDLSTLEAYNSFSEFMKKNGRHVAEKQREFASNLILKVASEVKGISVSEKKIIDGALLLLKIN